MTDHRTERGEVLERQEYAEVTADVASARNLPASARKLEAHDAALRAQLTRALVALRRAVNSNIIYPDAVSGDVDQSAIEWLEDVRANPPNGNEKGFARRTLQGGTDAGHRS